MKLDAHKTNSPFVGDSRGPVLLAHDVFYGALQSTRSFNGITVSHRIANSSPDDVKIRTHLEAHFVLVTCGRYVSTAACTPHHETTLIYNPPGTTHRDHFHEGKGSFFTVSLPNSGLAERADAAPSPDAVHLNDEKACGLAKAILMECARWDTSSSLKAESLCSELLALTSRDATPISPSKPAWLRIARELIQDSYRENLGVLDVAKVVGVHPTYLARAFRVFLGVTPGDLLRSRRLEKAAELLLRGKRPIVEIALDTGFSDQAHFTKAFRRVYGTSPGKYRQMSAVS